MECGRFIAAEAAAKVLVVAGAFGRAVWRGAPLAELIAASVP